MTEEKPLHVVELRAENVMRVKAVTVRPDGELVVVGGKNGQGKSSTLNAIEMALGGKGAIPPEPLRRGARKGKVRIDLGEYVVERAFAANGSTTLKLFDSEGRPVASPQNALAALYSSIAFDPLEFARMSDRQQAELLRTIMALDFSAIEARRSAAFAKRTEVNREVKALEARVSAEPETPGLPEQEQSVDALLAEQREARALQRKADLLRTDAGNHKSEAQKLRETAASLAEERERLAMLIEQHLSEEKLAIEASTRELEDAKRAEEEAAAIDIPDLAEIEERIRGLSDLNAKIRRNQLRLELEGKLTLAEDQAAELTAEIQECDQEKTAALAAAKFPIDGLGFGDDGTVTLDGLPFEQASASQKLRASAAIGAALNPRIKVMLVREASYLDADGMQLLAELARETGSQIWAERVSDDGTGCSIVIEDGMVKGKAEE